MSKPTGRSSPENNYFYANRVSEKNKREESVEQTESDKSDK